jgi:hypothetical protein
MKKVETKIISAAMYELARTIQSDDGVANAACAEAAERLDEQTVEISRLKDRLHKIDSDNNTIIAFARQQEALAKSLYEFMHEAVRHCWMGKSWTPQQIRDKGVELGLMVKKGKYVYAYSDELKKHFG